MSAATPANDIEMGLPPAAARAGQPGPHGASGSPGTATNALRRFFGIFPSERHDWVLLINMTIVVILVIVLLCPDVKTALAIIAILMALAAAICCLHQSPGAAREGYFPVPGAPAPHAVASMTAPPADAGHYPGSIDIDEYDTEAAYGHRDLTEGDADGVPMGNPYNIGRVAYPPAGEACVDDEANDAEIDGDESLAYHGVQRNDAARVTAGTMNRRRDLDKYFREEVEEAEDRVWWGRHEE